MKDDFKIFIENNRILALSKFRIPFDLYLLKGEKREKILSFRENLINSIKKLSIDGDNKILFGRYGQSDFVNAFYDVENILFYNIGASVFKNIVKNGISFSSFDNNELNLILNKYGNDYICVYEYSIVDQNLSCDGKIIAEWNNELCCKFKGSKPIDYWKAIKNIEEKISIFDCIDCGINDCFGLDLEVLVPSNTDFNIASAMKPFLDGLICAFHAQENMEKDFKYLKEKVNCTEDWLNNENINIFGKRQYLYKYRGNIKWNPADDLCKFVKIKLSYTNEELWKFSGRVYRI